MDNKGNVMRVQYALVSILSPGWPKQVILSKITNSHLQITFRSCHHFIRKAFMFKLFKFHENMLHLLGLQINMQQDTGKIIQLE